VEADEAFRAFEGAALFRVRENRGEFVQNLFTRTVRVRRTAGLAVAFRWLSRAAAIAVVPMVARAAPITVVDTGTGSQPLNAVFHADQLVPFLQAASTRRVDITGIGDSNQMHEGGGHQYGMQLAWANQFGMYATGVLPASANNAWPIEQIGYNAAGSFPSQATPAPASLAQYSLAGGDGFPATYAYLPAGSSDNYVSLEIAPQQPGGAGTLNGPGTLRFHYTYGTFTSGSGAFYPTATLPASSTVLASNGAGVQTNTGASGIADGYLDIADSAARQQNGAWVSFGRSPQISGPFFASYERAENLSVTHGVSYSTLLAQGGKSARDAALSLLSEPDTALREWLRQSTVLQNGTPMLMVNIIHGGNDRNQSALSVGPHPAPTNTPAGFEDNLDAIVTRIRQVWTAQGYDSKNLYFLLGGYQSSPFSWDGGTTANLETGAMAFADSTYNVAVVRGTQLLSAAAMQADGYYYNDGGFAHMTQASYENVDRITTEALLSTADPTLGGPRSNVSQFTVHFSADVSGSLTPGALKLTNTATGQVIDPADMSFTFDPTTDLATWTFPGEPGGVLPAGTYEADVLGSMLTDTDGNAGSDYSTTFAAPAPEPAAMALLLTAAVTGLGLRRSRRQKR
jgi:hypothetical protein